MRIKAQGIPTAGYNVDGERRGVGEVFRVHCLVFKTEGPGNTYSLLLLHTHAWLFSIRKSGKLNQNHKNHNLWRQDRDRSEIFSCFIV